MATRTDESSSPDEGGAAASLLDALLVYAEPLASGAHVIVIGDSESPVADRLLDLGARSVYVFDPDEGRATVASRSTPRGVSVRPLVNELDVRDGAFDLAVVPDLSIVEPAAPLVARLRRAVGSIGAVVAMARTASSEEESQDTLPFEADLGSSALGYNELYELFSAEFEDITLAGVVPFRGVVFAELGSEDESPAVSVDTRFAPSDPPSVFVVVAGGDRQDERTRRPALDPYAIVQIPAEPSTGLDAEATIALESAFAAAQLRADLVTSQLEEMREQVIVADVRAVEAAARLDRAAAERDAALTRAMELEAILSASQQTMAMVERRLLEAEQGMLERDDRIAGLSAELDTVHSASVTAPHPSPVEIEILVDRAERAEAALTEAAADLAHLAEAHVDETASYEEQLIGRARVIASLEKEVARREQLVKELVASLDESREGTDSVVFEAAPPLPPIVRPDPEVARLRTKLDELASDVARREGELVARGWRITELENELARVLAPAERKASPDSERSRDQRDDELDALRQALAQEHAARVAVESGEELARARSELARQAALLEQMRGRTESA
jgi:hypothetical protein